MKIIAHTIIVSDKLPNSSVFADISKEYACQLIPINGMDFEDSAWDTPKEILHVTLNPTEEYYFIYLGEEHYQDDEKCKARLEKFRLHGWK